MADFASMLKYLREREKLSQRELATKLGMSASAIGMYESGKRHPKYEDEEAIADFFNVDLNTLRGKRIYEDTLTDEERATYNTLLNAYKNNEILRKYSTEEIIEAIEFLDMFARVAPDIQQFVKQTVKSALSVPSLQQETGEKQA